MRTKLLNWRLISMLYLLGAMSNTFASGNVECQKILKIQPTTSISMDYLGWLAEPVVSTSADGGVVFRPFDEESHPVQGDWAGFGVVLADTGDIDAPSVGGIIWIRKGWRNRVHFEAATEGASIVFTIQTTKPGCAKTINFVISPDQTVNFGGESIGRVKSIVE
jgi:hypothetical protein